MGSLSAESPTIPPILEDDITHTGPLPAHGNNAVDGEYSRSDPELSEMNSYPPMSSQEAETRRVEETLRQWEIKEKQRRKAARESTSSTATASSSLLGDVTMRASLLWKSGNRTRNPLAGAKHMALGSTDNLDTVPLGAIPASPTVTPSPSLLSSPQPPQMPDSDVIPIAKTRVDLTNSEYGDHTENPFDTPENSFTLDTTSPFADEHRVDPDSTIGSSTERNQHSRPSLAFDHPERRISPAFPVISPPGPISSPNVCRQWGKGSNSGDDGQPFRWWHEWLCGCGEGSDRGGDNQAGRTNPLE